MKNKLLSIGMIGLTGVLLSSFMLVQKGDETQEPKKSRHIKMTKIENGKKMELDTILTNDDVFVWNGDTVNPVKHIGKSGSSKFDKIHQFDVKVDRRDGKENIMIFRNDGPEMLVPPPPPPPVPPFPHMKVLKMQHGGQIIDLNDPNIVSYKKKDVKGDMEKIEIIRKKSEIGENMTFDFNIDHDLMSPEAPEVPEFNWESEGDSLRMKIIEKRKVINGKNEKEIEIKVETEENK